MRREDLYRKRSSVQDRPRDSGQRAVVEGQDDLLWPEEARLLGAMSEVAVERPAGRIDLDDTGCAEPAVVAGARLGRARAGEREKSHYAQKDDAHLHPTAPQRLVEPRF
jgi:hypothetical protein